MTSEPDSTSPDTGASGQNTRANQPANPSRAFAPRPNLGRGFGAYTHPQGSYARPESGYSPTPPTRKNHPAAPVPSESTTHLSAHKKPKNHLFAGLIPWRAKPKGSPTPPLADDSQPQGFPVGAPPANGPQPYPSYSPDRLAEGPYGGPEGISPEGQLSTPPNFELAHGPTPRLWERQPYTFLLHLFLASGAMTMAWLFGILVAQILPGQFSEPPLQERFLRKSSRLTHQLWHFPQLWQTPTAQVRIEAMPLPETGPILGAMTLSPIERQPLIDELNAVETEILTLDRRLQSLEKQLGKPPYQGTGIESRINTMRTAIDPPVRNSVAPQTYEPIARDPGDTLLEVAKLNITLPSDALFNPGEGELKDAVLLERVLDQLVNYPGATISMRVHSDDQASAIASREYTLAQANTLARHLQNNLPTAHRWIPIGMGAAQPIVDNSDAISRQQNRRIEILVDTR